MRNQNVHSAERMTVEEAGVATSDRAIQLQGAAVALLAQQSARLQDWESTLDSWVENRPWQFLPEELEEKYGKWDLWTAATMRFNGDPLTRDRLIALLGGLYGSVSKAQTRVIEFEKAIEQPIYPKLGSKGGRPTGSKNPYPGQGLYGNDAGYLMGRLLQKDADIADKIGKGKQYRYSIILTRICINYYFLSAQHRLHTTNYLLDFFAFSHKPSISSKEDSLGLFPLFASSISMNSNLSMNLLFVLFNATSGSIFK